jgi:hypothetical protein
LDRVEVRKTAQYGERAKERAPAAIPQPSFIAKGSQVYQRNERANSNEILTGNDPISLPIEKAMTHSQKMYSFNEVMKKRFS